MGAHGLLEELGGHSKGGESQECPNCGACKELIEHVLFECSSYDSQGLIFVDYMKEFLPLNTSEAFFVATFCLGEKQGILVNDEYSSSYNRVADVLIPV